MKKFTVRIYMAGGDNFGHEVEAETAEDVFEKILDNGKYYTCTRQKETIRVCVSQINRVSVVDKRNSGAVASSRNAW